ncbi:GAF domain-containing protein [Paraburkholderia sp. Ac-20340]|uniref:ATP-binding protein n=1 Tax=Paraburkholderia sp. Ac-20340 TaxID=2703888 RepID=UPI00197FC6D7|nr:ATP-binding protein [Paraburkholderia sp. Ac-20340]MBN3858836.1 GAF domain-containing protein [Paraburkholderia sp. Ac-20340]
MTHQAPASTHASQADCASEPIHLPGSIQPHGFLISLDHDGRIAQLSANAGALAGTTAQALLGAPLAQLIGESAAQATLAALAEPASDGTPRFIGAIADPRDLRTPSDAPADAHPPLAIVAHRYDGIAIVELEPALGTADVFSSLYPLVRTFLRGLQECETVDDLARLAANEVKRITGFGRTLVYNFDDDGNGHVIAEALDTGYASYLDQHFPAADIPAQARALYVHNRIRLIADAGYASVPLVPPLHPATGRPTDLTWASLRSVSPVHVQYMKNMGTGASMSMSIVVRGRLWGLISCHHAHARVPAFEVRAACEHIAQMLSLQVEAREDRAQAEYRLALRHRLSRLLAAMANSEHFVTALSDAPRDLLGLANATGAAIVFDGRIVTVGTTPDKAQIEAILSWLDRQDSEIYAADQFASDAAVPFHHDAAGMLAVSISRLFRNYVIWFRPEVVRALKWAGDPRAKLATLANSLSPRASFEVWTEEVRERSLPWHAAEQEIALEFRAALLDIVLRRAEELAQLALELGRANQELEGFSYTVSHDLRAPLRHIVGFADLLAQNEGERLSARGKHFIERIADSARFGGKLVDDLLAFSQMGRAALHKQRVDLNRLVKELVADQQRDHPQRTIEWRIDTLHALIVDPVLMHVVLRNLIDNAVKFTSNHANADDPAIIEIGCSAGADDSPLANHDIVFVRDNGVGFDARYVGKLFGVFQRLHRFEDFEGTGIGLASVKRIVERHGGSTWAEGKLDVGTTVSFAIPRSAGAAPAQSGPETAAAAVARLASVTPEAQPFRNVRKPE